jgi:hypothetical protein
MACGCGGKKNNNQQRRTNLQSPRKPFVPPGQPVNNPNLPAPVQGSANFMLQQKALANPQQPPVSAADRRRIQRLHAEAIRKSLNR